MRNIDALHCAVSFARLYTRIHIYIDTYIDTYICLINKTLPDLLLLRLTLPSLLLMPDAPHARKRAIATTCHPIQRTQTNTFIQIGRAAAAVVVLYTFVCTLKIMLEHEINSDWLRTPVLDHTLTGKWCRQHNNRRPHRSICTSARVVTDSIFCVCLTKLLQINYCRLHTQRRFVLDSVYAVNTVHVKYAHVRAAYSRPPHSTSWLTKCQTDRGGRTRVVGQMVLRQCVIM